MKKNKATVIIAVLLFMNPVFISGCTNTFILIPEEILSKALSQSNKYNTYYSEGTYKYYINSKLKKHFIIKDWFQKGGLNRKTELIDQGTTKDDRIYIKKRNTYFDYIRKRNKLYISNSYNNINNFVNFREMMLKNFTDIKECCNIIFLGSEKLGGLDTYHIKFTRKNKARIVTEMWVDKKSFFTPKTINIMGNMTSVVNYKSIKFSPKFSKSCFTIIPEKSTKIINTTNIEAPKNVSLVAAAKALGKPLLYYNSNPNVATLSSVNSSCSIDEDNDKNILIINQIYISKNVPVFSITARHIDKNTTDYMNSLKIKKCKIRGHNALYNFDMTERSIYWEESGLCYFLQIFVPNLDIKDIQNICDNMSFQAVAK